MDKDIDKDRIDINDVGDIDEDRDGDGDLGDLTST